MASACVWTEDCTGQVLIIILTANFGYVGSSQDYTIGPSLAVQNNEVEELNNGKVSFSSTDQDSDFRVGDAFSEPRDW